MTGNPCSFVVVSDQTPSLIDITAGFRLQSAALDLGTAVMVAMSAKKHGAEHPFEGQYKGADPFPADIPLRGDLEHTAALALADERVAVPEPIGAGNVTAEETEHVLRVVLPHDLAGRHVHFNDTGAGHNGVVSSVVKDEHVPLGSKGGIVLVADPSSSPFPQDFAFRPGDAHHRAEFSKTEQHVAVRACLNRIGVTPLVPELPTADNVRFRVEVLPGVPRVHRVSLRVDLQNGVPEETAQVPGPAPDSEPFHEKAEVVFVFRESGCGILTDEALDPFGKVRRHLLPGDNKGASVGKAAHVVMKGRVLPTPDLLPSPVDFNQDIGSTSRGRDSGSGLIQRLASNEQVSSRKEIAVPGPERREMPAMNNQAGIVEEIGRVPADGRDEGEPAACAGVFVRKSCLPKWRPAHE